MSIRGSFLRLMARWSSCALVVLGLAVVSGASLSAQPAAAQPAGAGVGRRRSRRALRAARAGARRRRLRRSSSRLRRPSRAERRPPVRLRAAASPSRGRRAPSSASAIARRSRTPPRAPPSACCSRSSSSTRAARAAARTWSIDAPRTPADGDWRLADAEALSSADGLNRLALDPHQAVPRPQPHDPRRGSAAHVPERRRLRRDRRRTARRAWCVIGDGAMQFTPKPTIGAGAAPHLLRRDRAARADRRRLPALSPGRSRRSRQRRADRGAGRRRRACAAPRRSSTRRSASRSASSWPI